MSVWTIITLILTVVCVIVFFFVWAAVGGQGNTVTPRGPSRSSGRSNTSGMLGGIGSSNSTSLSKTVDQYSKTLSQKTKDTKNKIGEVSNEHVRIRNEKEARIKRDQEIERKRIEDLQSEREKRRLEDEYSNEQRRLREAEDRLEEERRSNELSSRNPGSYW